MIELLWETLTLSTYNTRLVVLGAALLGAASGLIGSFLLLRKQSLLGDALSHATLPGIALAFAVLSAFGLPGRNLPALLTGAAVTGALGVLLVLAIRRTTRLKDDAAMGIVLSVFFGLGVVLLRMVQEIPGQSSAGLESFIYGKTASMVRTDLYLIIGILSITVAVCLLLRKELTLLCFDDAYANSQGFSATGLDILLMGLVTAVTVVGLQAVGLILVIAFLIIPATAARFWTHRLPVMLVLATVLGTLSGWLGASLSALYAGLPSGAIIVLTAAFFFLVSLFFGTARGMLPRYLRYRALQRKVGRQHLLRSTFEILEEQQEKAYPLRNTAITMDELRAHRYWSKGELGQLIRQGRREDHLDPQPRGAIRLSESGFGEAARITRNHRLWELYLIRHADIAPNHVDRDADMVEHLLGPEVVMQLEEELGMNHREPVVASPHEILPENPPAS